MLKFLRKYQTFLLVVGGCFLMVVFVAPQAVQQFGPKPENIKVASFEGRKVTAGELDRAGREKAALDQWNPFLTGAVLNLETEPDHWFLLRKAAERGGYIGGADDAISWIPELADQLTIERYRAQGVADAENVLEVEFVRGEADQLAAQLEQTRAAVAASAGFTLEEFDQTIAAARGVLRMTSAYQTAVRLSEQRFNSAMRRLDDQAFAGVVSIPADAVLDNVREPTEEELQAHFDEYREQEPADNDFGIGYTLGPRIRFEYMVLNWTDLLDSIQLDELDVIRYYRNRQGALGPSLEPVRGEVELRMRTERASAAFDAAHRAVRTEVLRRLRALPKDADGEPIVPEDWEDRPTMDELARIAQIEMSESIGSQAPLPEVFSTGEQFIDQTRYQDTETYPEFVALATAQVRQGAQTFPLFTAMRSVPEIESNLPFDVRVGVPSVDIYGTMEDDPRFERGFNNNRVYFTVLAAKDTSPADNIEQVRDLVTRDWKRLRALEWMDGQIEEWENLVRSEGMDALALKLNPPVRFDEFSGRPIDEGPFVPVEIDPSAKFTRRSIDSYFNELEAQAREFGPIVVDYAVENINVNDRGQFIPEDVSVISLRSEFPQGYYVLDYIGWLPGLQNTAQEEAGVEIAEEAMSRELVRALREEPTIPPFSLVGLAERFSYDNPDLGLDERREESLERVKELAEQATRFGVGDDA